MSIDEKSITEAGQAVVRVDDDARLGPAMLALPTPMMRNFVQALVQLGCSATKAAELAGYSTASPSALRGYAWKLKNDARIQAAILEEGVKLIRADGPMALNVLRTVAKDKSAAPRDRLKAATEILNRGGFHAVTEHHVSVMHQTEAEKDREIVALATELGLDDAAKAKLLGKPIVTDATFEIVDPPTDIAPPREPRGAKIQDVGRTPEDRARERMRRRETPEQRAARHERDLERRRAEGKAKYAAAQRARAGSEGLEDLLDMPTEPEADQEGRGEGEAASTPLAGSEGLEDLLQS